MTESSTATCATGSSSTLRRSEEIAPPVDGISNNHRLAPGDGKGRAADRVRWLVDSDPADPCFPFIGALGYLIFRGSDMHTRENRQSTANEDMLRQYLNSGPGASTADELHKLAALRENGVLTEDEFAAQKAKLLG
jgi:hypothetical protein